MILKKSAKQRLHKAELLEARRAKEGERAHIAHLMEAEAALAARHFRIEDAVSAIDQGEKMVSYLKDKGIMDGEGNVKT